MSPTLAMKLPNVLMRAPLPTRGALSRIGRPQKPGAAFWPWAVWAVVALLILVYIAQDHNLPQPAEGELADLDCLALNIYFEARNEPLSGKRAVGHVVMNRVRDAQFPASICQVIRDGGERRRDRCQFSWWCDGQSDRPRDDLAWRESRQIAWDVLRGTTRDPTGGALWYHADYVAPAWRAEFGSGHRIGRHIFYTRPN